MKIFLDSVNIEEIKKAHQIGILDGVTTNPTLVAKEGGDFLATLKNIAKIFKDNKEAPISAEVISTDYNSMLKEAHDLAKIDKRIVIKVPLIPEGIRVIKTLASEGVKTNATLCFSATQALLAAKAGATYVSPFLGRLDDIGEDSLLFIQEIKEIFNNYNFSTKILAASIRSVEQVVEVAIIGVDAITLPFKIFEQLFKHPLTDKGLAKFLTDWQKYKAVTRK